MEIEAGKYYRTRDGQKAFVVATHSSNPFLSTQGLYPVVGYIAGITVVCSWTVDGASQAHQVLGYDLVSEWREPEKMVRWANLYRSENGDLWSWECYDSLEVAKSAAQKQNGSICIARKCIEFVEGEFNDG